MFADFYGVMAREHMAKYGSTPRHFAMVSAKNSFHGSLNPHAQYQTEMSIDEVLAQPMIVEPLTRPMLCPVADGGAAVIVVSERKARQLGIAKPVRGAACSTPTTSTRRARKTTSPRYASTKPITKRGSTRRMST